jgi:hypothetical protein
MLFIIGFVVGFCVAIGISVWVAGRQEKIRKQREKHIRNRKFR